jgi:hypothetical protein
MILIVIFALLSSINAYLHYGEVNETLVLEFRVVKGTDPNVL